ncbi:MAG: aryl-sulfate sulfotransferase [Imperialibacter sp.]|uniref:aryl-sulfate sulfotransferase n=1 Tax=Imperialibacter sp. TaxID=2038411 RepID=UPI0032EB013C
MKRLDILAVASLIAVMCACQGSSGTSKDAISVVPPLASTVKLYNPDLIDSSSVFVVESGGTSAYLISKAGKRLYTWTFGLSLGADIELLPNGKLLGMFKAPTPGFSFGGGYGGVIQIINPDSSVDWEFQYVSDDLLAHHDLTLLPNGNILFLAWEKIDSVTAKKAGASVGYDIYPEKVVEIDTATREVVWEWRSWDHIVQDKLNGAPTYGVVAERPDKININYLLRPDGDLMHANGIDYDLENDLIFISVNYFSEVWVVDHSASTEEARGGSGGKFGKGGNLIYRFGNPEAYGNAKGTRLFDRIHFPNLLRKEGRQMPNVLIYENGLTAKRSTVYEFEMPEELQLLPDWDNEPKVVWSFTDSLLSYGRISGAVRTNNGNTLICEGDYGFWEVTADGEVAWKYNDTSATFWRGYAYYENDEALSFLKGMSTH